MKSKKEKEPLVELKTLRTTFGNDESAINRHSYRYYRKGSLVYMLDKTLDGDPPFYSLTIVPRKKATVYQTVRINQKEYWGDGFSWAKAERLIMNELDAAGIQRDNSEKDEYVRFKINN